MQPTFPLPLHHSWPLTERMTRLDLGRLDLVVPGGHQGRWSCALTDQSLTWDAEVHRLFGFPRGRSPSRVETVACYSEPSRAAMERLRAHAIRHRRGFTIDVEITPADQPESRWIRLCAVPRIEAGRVTVLEGSKHDVTPLYRA